jgi:hypothetical protein
MNPAEQIDQILVGENSVLYRPEEVLNGKVPQNAVIVDGIVRNFVFHPKRLELSRDRVKHLIEEIVSDKFFKGGGEGASFLELCFDREGRQWGEHRLAEALVCLAMGLGMAGYCLPREMWPALPGCVPYVWFHRVETKPCLTNANV